VAERRPSFADVVSESVARATTEPSYLGSEAHLTLLEEYLRGVLPADVRIEWLPPGNRSYYEYGRKLVALERASDLAPDRAKTAEYAAAVALHESLHAAYGEDVGNDFRSRVEYLSRGRPQISALVESLFNHVEDARLTACVVDDDPSARSYLEYFNRAALRQHLVEPTTPRNRFFNALLELIAIGHPADVDADVTAPLAEAEVHVTRALAGSTPDAGRAALELARIFYSEQLDDPDQAAVSNPV
jgi:hypothetical protein